MKKSERTKHLVCERLLGSKSLAHTRCFVLGGTPNSVFFPSFSSSLGTPDPIVFISITVNTSGRLYDDFIHLLFHAHRETSPLTNELPGEESNQFRFLRAASLAHLKGSVGLIGVTSSVMRVSIPLPLISTLYPTSSTHPTSRFVFPTERNVSLFSVEYKKTKTEGWRCHTRTTMNTNADKAQTVIEHSSCDTFVGNLPRETVGRCVSYFFVYYEKERAK